MAYYANFLLFSNSIFIVMVYLIKTNPYIYCFIAKPYSILASSMSSFANSNSAPSIQQQPPSSSRYSNASSCLSYTLGGQYILYEKHLHREFLEWWSATKACTRVQDSGQD